MNPKNLFQTLVAQCAIVGVCLITLPQAVEAEAVHRATAQTMYVPSCARVGSGNRIDIGILSNFPLGRLTLPLLQQQHLSAPKMECLHLRLCPAKQFGQL